MPTSTEGFHYRGGNGFWKVPLESCSFKASAPSLTGEIRFPLGLVVHRMMHYNAVTGSRQERVRWNLTRERSESSHDGGYFVGRCSLPALRGG
jgi:hypothetical protein